MHERSIVYKDTSTLIPYVGNSRTHSDAQVKQIAASIQEFGFTNPILIDENAGVIAGHGRILAATLVNEKKVPCIVLSGLTKAQKKALVIADNKISLNADWDLEKLTLELEGLGDLEYDLTLTGFIDEELSAMILGDISSAADYPNLPEGDKSSLREISFVFDGEQAETVQKALAIAKEKGDFSAYINTNSNANAITWIVEHYLDAMGLTDE